MNWVKQLWAFLTRSPCTQDCGQGRECTCATRKGPCTGECLVSEEYASSTEPPKEL